MDEDSKTGLAIAMINICRAIAAGESTDEDAKEDDMSTGATQAQVDDFYGFVQPTFCPAVRPAVDDD